MFGVMSRRRLLRAVDSKRISEAIEAAEKQTSGEICVSVAPLFWGDVRRAAEKAFQRLGMTGTKARNGVLFFVVPSRRRFVILGDRGIHEKVGQEFWEAVAAAVSGKFKDGDYTGGLVDGIEEVGRQLAVHFPSEGSRDVNELPNEPDVGSN